MEKVLVIDSSPDRWAHITECLADDYHLVVEEKTEDALGHDLSQFTAFLVGAQMPPFKGDSVISLLRQRLKRPAPLCLISESNCEKSLTAYNKCQADELLSQSASSTEIRGRFRTALKRVKNFYRHLEFGPIRINLSQANVWVHGEIFECTATEYRILCTLLGELGTQSFVPRETFIKNVWGDVSVEDRTISTHLSNLNKKLKKRNVRIKTKRLKGLFLEY